MIRLIGNQKNKKLKKNRPIGDPKVKGQETDDCFFWFFVFLVFGDPKTKKTKKNRPIGDPKVKGQETDDCVFLGFLVFGDPKTKNPKNQKKNKIDQ